MKPSPSWPRVALFLALLLALASCVGPEQARFANETRRQNPVYGIRPQLLPTFTFTGSTSRRGR